MARWFLWLSCLTSRFIAQAFEWVVRDVSRLRDYIENPPLMAESENAAEELDDEFDVLRESPELGDGKFKLEICACFSLCFLVLELTELHSQDHNERARESIHTHHTRSTTDAILIYHLPDRRLRAHRL